MQLTLQPLASPDISQHVPPIAAAPFNHPLRVRSSGPDTMLLSTKAFATVRPAARTSVRTNATYSITMKSPRGGEKTFECSSEQYILDAAEAAGCDLPNSCRSGTCTTCAGKLAAGQVDQSEQNFLDDEQMNQGFALLCVSYPRSDCVIVAEQHALNPLMK